MQELSASWIAQRVHGSMEQPDSQVLRIPPNTLSVPSFLEERNLKYVVLILIGT